MWPKRSLSKYWIVGSICHAHSSFPISHLREDTGDDPSILVSAFSFKWKPFQLFSFVNQSEVLVSFGNSMRGCNCQCPRPPHPSAAQHFCMWKDLEWRRECWINTQTAFCVHHFSSRCHETRRHWCGQLMTSLFIYFKTWTIQIWEHTGPPHFPVLCFFVKAYSWYKIQYISPIPCRQRRAPYPSCPKGYNLRVDQCLFWFTQMEAQSCFQLHSCWQVLQMECRWVLLSLAFSHGSSFLRTATLWGRCMQMGHSIPTKHTVLHPVSQWFSKCGYILKVLDGDVRQWTPFWSRVVHTFLVCVVALQSFGCVSAETCQCWDVCVFVTWNINGDGIAEAVGQEYRQTLKVSLKV